MLKEIKIKIPKDNGGFEEYEVCETKINLFNYFIRELESLKEKEND